MQRQTSSAIYPVENYTFGHKEPKLEKDRGTGDRLQRWKRAYEAEGMRRTVEGVCLTQRHNHPHLLLLQVGSTFFKLPGGKVRPGVDELETLKRKLSTHLSPSPTHIKWDIGECLGVFWRPNFETQMYPYLPPHVTRPKEIKKLYLICLPERAAFAVRRAPRQPLRTGLEREAPYRDIHGEMGGDWKGKSKRNHRQMHSCGVEAVPSLG